MITTRPKCSKKLFPFIGDLMQMIPNSFYYPRGNHLVADLCKYATNKSFTHLIILAERGKVCEGYVFIFIQ
jgi:ribosome production factor 1